eukprot:g7439.t1
MLCCVIMGGSVRGARTLRCALVGVAPARQARLVPCCGHFSNRSSVDEAQIVHDARKGREGGWSVEQMITREFQGETANALGTSGSKLQQMLDELGTLGTAVAGLGAGSARARKIGEYNALRQKALAARQNLVIQREAAGMGGSKVGVLRVDVIRDSMGGGPAESADDVVRREYPLPKALDSDGRAS